jgi:putative ABC transport system permease protein
MSPLDKKLVRDVWRLKAQVAAIAVVIAFGVLLLVMMDGLVNSLDETKRAYYERYRLADVFAPIKRAPKRLVDDIAKIPGVAAVEGRISGGALIDLAGIDAPIRAQALSLPPNGRPRFNDVFLSDGRPLDGRHVDEVLLLRGFARAHGLLPGAKIEATINGFKQTLKVVGLAEAPEFLYAVAPGELAPDDARFAVLWMNEDALAAAFDLDGAFNEALIGLAREARIAAVLDAVDERLDSSGGLGAYHRHDHLSDRYIREEIEGLKASGRTVPPVFLAIAAFLLYIVISRMLHAEREEIGLMKAVGYRDIEIAAHYAKFILTIAAVGALLGCVLGILAGRRMVVLYLEFFKFPFLVFDTNPSTFVFAIFASLMAASAGGVVVVGGIFRLSPAVAMRPPAPPDYSRSALFLRPLAKLLDPVSRLIMRRMVRQPIRTLSAIAGIASGMAISAAMLSVMSGFDYLLELNFSGIERGDATVTLNDPLGQAALYRLRRMPGVIEAEPFRSVPVIFRNGLTTYKGALIGLVTRPRLYRVIDDREEPIYVREDGAIVSSALADILNVEPGQVLTVEVREGRRPSIEVPIAAIAKTPLGAPAYFAIGSLNRALKEPDRISGAYLRVDQAREGAIYRDLKDMPAIAGVRLRRDARAAVRNLLDQGAGAIRYIMMGVAMIITFGIVFNAARIAFAERIHDLATIRILGFTKIEAGFILLGELAIITVLALPAGAIMGYWLAGAIAAGFSTDLYQIPATFSPEAYGIAALAVIAAAVGSGWLVKRDLDQLDLVSVLKAQD